MKSLDERNGLIRKTRTFEDPYPMQTMRTTLLSHKMETLLGLRLWSNQEAAKLLLADAYSQQGSKNKVVRSLAYVVP